VAEGAASDDVTKAADAAGRAPPALAKGLYIVATPIGNLRDITLRALDTLKDADLVLAEDTRVTHKLLARYGISAPLQSYHEHNAAKMRPRVLAQLKAGKAIALVSDAGTPLVSDPGYKLVAEAIAQGHAVHVVPGASALTAALAASGLPTDRVLFLGFLPPRAAARRAALEEIKEARATLVLFEAPGRLAALLADLAAVFGTREAAIARELTKRFEEVRRGLLSELAAAYAGAAPKGEIAVVVAPPAVQAPTMPAADLDARLAPLLKKKSLREAVAEVANATGLPRRQVYARALALKDKA
jgi:16S rRNA (cytidine1402-2'-O)-methyltransferase